MIWAHRRSRDSDRELGDDTTAPEPQSSTPTYDTGWGLSLLVTFLAVTYFSPTSVRVVAQVLLGLISVWRLIVLFRMILRDDPDFNGQTEREFFAKRKAEQQGRHPQDPPA